MTKEELEQASKNFHDAMVAKFRSDIELLRVLSDRFNQDETEPEEPEEEFELTADFDESKAKEYFDALLKIASQRKIINADSWYPDNSCEVSMARKALGLAEDIPEIDDDF